MNIQTIIEKFFNVDSRTSATILVSLTVFFLGFLVKGIINAFQKYFERKANKRLFIRTLETLIVSLMKRRELLELQLNILNPKTIRDVPATRIQFFQAAIFNSIGHKRLFETFFYGYGNFFRSKQKKMFRNKAFLKVWENMANIEFWENNMYEMMEPAQKEMNRLNEIMNTASERLRKEYMTLFHQAGVIDVQEKEFITELNKVIYKWEQMPNNRTAYNVNEFSTKMIEAVCEKYSYLSSARQLKDLARDASYYYRNMLVPINTLIISLKNYRYAIDYFRRSTKVIIKILN